MTSTASALQAAAPPVGLVEVTTSPRPSTATHSNVPGHETAAKAKEPTCEVVQAAANALNVAADANTIACNLLGTIDWALETGRSFEEVAEELLAQVQGIIDLSWDAQNASEDLLLLVCDAILE